MNESQLRAVSVDLAVKFIAINKGNGRATRAGEVVAIARIFNDYLVEAK